jgi:hypothetical protein
LSSMQGSVRQTCPLMLLIFAPLHPWVSGRGRGVSAQRVVHHTKELEITCFTKLVSFMLFQINNYLYLLKPCAKVSGTGIPC